MSRGRQTRRSLLVGHPVLAAEGVMGIPAVEQQQRDVQPDADKQHQEREPGRLGPLDGQLGWNDGGCHQGDQREQAGELGHDDTGQ
jgi:hypothetical protein